MHACIQPGAAGRSWDGTITSALRVCGISWAIYLVEPLIRRRLTEWIISFECGLADWSERSSEKTRALKFVEHAVRIAQKVPRHEMEILLNPNHKKTVGKGNSWETEGKACGKWWNSRHHQSFSSPNLSYDITTYKNYTKETKKEDVLLWLWPEKTQICLDRRVLSLM